MNNYPIPVGVPTAYAQSLMFPVGEPNDAYAQYFTGRSWLAPVSGEQVSMIIDARVDEMLEMIDDAVKKSGIRLGNWSNVYFTGGGLMPMNGARVYAAGKLARNVREAAAKTVKLKPAQIYASGSGLLELVYNTIEQEEQDEGLFDRIKRVFKKR